MAFPFPHQTMSLDATEVRLTSPGTLTLHKDGTVMLEGFEGEDCTCRDVATLALAWAIGKLQAELVAQIERPGGSGNVSVD